MTDECGKGGCVLPVGHRPVRDVLPMPFQEHASSPWVRGAYLQALEKDEDPNYTAALEGGYP